MIDPVLIRIGPFSITWYALSYVVSLLIGLALIKKLSRKYSIFKMTLIDIDILFNYIVVGIILGGRLGHVIFFDPVYYFYHPIEIFKIWNGGMSFHGGLIGVIFCIHKFSATRKATDFWKVMDITALVAPVGLFFGRIANFINQELYGIPTDSIFGFVFTDVDSVPRHPTQLYEAFFEGLFLYIVLRVILKKSIKYSTYFYGLISGYFCIFYSIARFCIEFLKVPDTTSNLTLVTYLNISIGQILCVLMFLFGVILIKIKK